MSESVQFEGPTLDAIPKPLVFFGAGASKEFGIPTMSEMVGKFEETLKVRSGELALYKDIKGVLEGRYGNGIDIESIFSVVNGIAEGGDPEKIGHYPFYYVKKQSKQLSSLDSKQADARVLLEKLENFVKEKCNIDFRRSDIGDIFQKSYKVFFNNMRGAIPQDNLRDKVIHGIWQGVTTNYDLVFENYWNEDITLYDFFDSKSNELAVLESNMPDRHCLVKLHGSIDWRRLKSGIIKKITPRSAYTKREDQGAAMLYPISQKNLTEYPWDSLFQYFKEMLRKCNCWYIVGYALNDAFVLNAMLETLENHGKRDIIIIDPNANKLKEKFNNINENHTQTLPAKFGSKYFPGDFVDFVRDQRTLDIELSSDVDCFGISLLNQKTPIENIQSRRNCSNPHVKVNNLNYNVFYNVPLQNESRPIKSNDELSSVVESHNMVPNMVKFHTCLNGITPIGINFELIVHPKNQVNVSVFNQKRLIHNSSVNDFPNACDVGEFRGMGVSKMINIPMEKLWPVE